MKSIATKYRQFDEGWLADHVGPFFAIVFVTLMVTGCLLGVVRSNELSSGWRKHSAHVIVAGTVPIKSNDRLVKSTVSWQNNGQQFSRSFNLEWWKHVGTSMSVWTKGSAGALSDPTGPRSAIFAGIVLGFVAGAVIFFILLGLSAISGALVESYAAKEAKARAEGDADRAAPATREEFIELCRTHSKITVTPDDVIALGACSTGVYTFRDIHFPGRDTVTLGELVRFMDRNNVYWSWVMKVANSKLRDVGVVRSDYFYSGFVRTPTDWLEDEVTASADS